MTICINFECDWVIVKTFHSNDNDDFYVDDDDESYTGLTFSDLPHVTN